ncbi:hypothetical protein COX69_01655 [Candidatus Falkowbacteria bacterium CG_4_10_14_0_2_um_filter_48_10]|uniref:50S ribosomal protein L7/L12 n=1 Tax=Candidatus Falkowbacteria bacterium CG23_combo_of_CG06-09_8_20_14_all_49_15 TaxID=1974572 RepID=A0A2G9ZK43_9BACT|nr:MAG: hypothetical protein COX22_03870 [Candidatus Falkowbacteria bacterium CG23_combo_of_CG06-09_8_20_14_all_49_15]PJA08630.1 MAG: hypothetical protein COX69_01655 [Candidatus Falkowbacteria bacterium CG_4_10_14_0_2_um_filter_48_10]
MTKINKNTKNENQEEKLNWDELEDNYQAPAAIGQEKSPAVMVSQRQLALLRQLAMTVKESNEKILDLLSVYNLEDLKKIKIGQAADEDFTEADGSEGRIIEGVFDGEQMIGPDGKRYSVPSNYASKSKLVEGDIMKLTIAPNGTFIYKQIGPIERSRVIGSLEKADNGNYYVAANGRQWRILTASVTYFKGQIGDETVILVPKTGESQWAAVENIVRAAR